MFLPFEQSNGGQGENTRSFGLPDYKRRQVMDMNAYEVVMICIASMTLLLKVIEVIYNLNRK